MNPSSISSPSGFQRYTRQTPSAMRWYVALQYALLVPLMMHFLGIVKDIPTADALVYAAIVAVTAVALGALLECLSWARWLELLRLLARRCVPLPCCRIGLASRHRLHCVAAVLVFAIGSAALASAPLVQRAQQVPA
jgi:hypothetical protein